MGRRKNKSNDNQNSMKQQNNSVCFEDQDVETTGSSNLKESVTAVDITIEDESMCDADVSFVDGEDDKTSADYYFDSYSHFGIFLIYCF